MTVQEWVKYRIILGAVSLFLFSMCMSWTELRYLIWGQTVEATVMGTHFEKSNRDIDKKQVQEYFFNDHDDLRREGDDVPLDWTEPQGGKVTVQFIPGRHGASRIAGTHHLNFLWAALFLGSLGVALWKAACLWREAYK